MNSRTMQHISGIVLSCLLAIISLPVQAEYITDKIVINIHAERFGQGAILKTLPSGTTVTVLMNDGDYSRVRTNDNITGWVESKYITNEKPAQLEYLELITKSKTLEAQLKAANEKLSEQPNGEAEGVDLAELSELRKRATDAGWMRVELKKARDLASELEGKLNSINKNNSGSEQELNKLREQNKLLEKRLAATLLVNKQQASELQETSLQQPQSENSASNLETENTLPETGGAGISIGWYLGSIVVAIIIGLVAGMKWLDSRIRQRHGGFRIY